MLSPVAGGVYVPWSMPRNPEGGVFSFKKLPRHWHWMWLAPLLLKAEAALPQGPVELLPQRWTQLEQPSLPQISLLSWKAPRLQMQEMPPQHKPGADNLVDSGF